MLRNRVPSGHLVNWSSEVYGAHISSAQPDERISQRSLKAGMGWDGMEWGWGKKMGLTLNLSLGWYGGERKKKRENEKKEVFIGTTYGSNLAWI